MTQRDELEFQFCAAANPASQPREDSRDECEHAGDITGRRVKSPDFSLLFGFSAGTADNRGVSHTRDVAVRGRAPGARLRTFRCDKAPDRSLIVRANALSVSAQMRGPPHRTEIPQSRRLAK